MNELLEIAEEYLAELEGCKNAMQARLMSVHMGTPELTATETVLGQLDIKIKRIVDKINKAKEELKCEDT